MCKESFYLFRTPLRYLCWRSLALTDVRNLNCQLPAPPAAISNRICAGHQPSIYFLKLLLTSFCIKISILYILYTSFYSLYFNQHDCSRSSVSTHPFITQSCRIICIMGRSPHKSVRFFFHAAPMEMPLLTIHYSNLIKWVHLSSTIALYMLR